MDIIKKAIKNGEIADLLEGKNGYILENDTWASISAPIDWTIIIPQIYIEYENGNENHIKEEYENAIKMMLEGNAEDTYCGLAVLYFQILREETDRSPFYLERNELINSAKNGISKNKEDLKRTKKWAGMNCEEGLWEEVQKYRRLLLSKYGIEV